MTRSSMVVGHGRERVRISRRSREASADILTPGVAVAWLRRHSAGAQRRSIVRHLRELLDRAELDDESVVALSLGELGSSCGRLELRRVHEPHLAGSSSDSSGKPLEIDDFVASELVEDSDWLEILVVDDDDRPVPGISCEVVLPNGALRRGRTNAAGILQYEGIPAGVCEVRLSKVDAADWAPA